MVSRHYAFLIIALANPRIRRGLMLVLFVTVLAVVVWPAAAQLETRPFAHNGYTRTYLTYRPAHLSSNPAAVFMLGGIRSTAESASRDFGWIDEADRNGFLVVFPDPVATQPDKPMDRKSNVTFWELKGSRTHLLAPGMLPVDDDGYLMAVLHDVVRRDHPDRERIYFAGFSSGSGMVQLFASHHPKDIKGIVAVATPLMDPPAKLAHPVPVLYIHGDEDEQFSGFQANSPHFATTPHGNWVTWGYLDGCQIQKAERTEWGVRFSWQGCKNSVPVLADFVRNLGHEWSGSLDSHPRKDGETLARLNFTDMAWQFFAGIHAR
jgi:polyhydroxybutyrate depolymerase